MSSIRLGQRIPSRPSAQQSPSPDKGIKSIIVSTTPPKIQKQHLDSKRQKDMAIHKIKEENKKLKEQMKILLDKNKDIVNVSESKFRPEKGTIKKNQKKDEIKEEIFLDERTTQKPYSRHEKKEFGNQSNLVMTHNFEKSIDIRQIKSQLLLLVGERQSAINKQMQYLELKICKVEQTQLYIFQRIKQLGSLKTLKKHKSSFQTKSNKGRQHSLSYQYERQEPVDHDSILTPQKSQLRHRQVIHQLENQLKGAEMTIHKLQMILKNEQKASQQIKYQTHKKDELYKELKLENQNFARDLKIAYKQANQSRQLKIYYEKQIDILNSRIKELQQSRQYHRNTGQEVLFNKTNELRLEQQIKFLKKEVEKYRQEEQNKIQTSIKQRQKEENETIKREQERKRIAKMQIDELQNKMEQTNNILKVLEDQIEIEKKEKDDLELEISYLKTKAAQDQRQIQSLIQLNNLLNQTLKDSNGVSQKVIQQAKQIHQLQAQLSQRASTLRTIKSQHAEEIQSYCKELKQIKIFIQSIKPESEQLKAHHSRQIQQSENRNLAYRQQIARLQSQVVALRSEKDLIQESSRYAQQQNLILKQQIKELKQSIIKYSQVPSKSVSVAGQQIQSTMMVEQYQIGTKLKASNRWLSQAVNKLNHLYQNINQQVIQDSTHQK